MMIRGKRTLRTNTRVHLIRTNGAKKYCTPARRHRNYIPYNGDTVGYISAFGRINNLCQVPFIIEGKEHVI